MFALTPYRKEQARTLSRQKDLPRLPIQPLASVLEKYIQTLRPFLLDQADREGKDQQWVEQELDKRREWASDFDRQGGLGRLLQERLKGEFPGRELSLDAEDANSSAPASSADIDRITPNNWLDDHFWIKVAYHSWRVSLVVNSNWWLMCKEDESIPADVRAKGAPDGTCSRISEGRFVKRDPDGFVPATTGEFTDWQIRRAANLAKRPTDFKVRLDRYVPRRVTTLR